MIPTNLCELLSFSAAKYPGRTAIVFGRKKINYRALNELADDMAYRLSGLGIKKGDKVALFLDNCPEFIISYYAILKAGCVAVPVNYMFKPEETRFILEDSGSVCMITSKVYQDMAQELKRVVGCLKYVITARKTEDDTLDSPKITHKDRVVADDLAVILYTSGTTGHPKGAMLTHHNLTANALDCKQAISLTHKDSVVCILPLFHSFAATVCMNLPLLIGAKIVIMKSVRPFSRVIRSIIKHRVTIFVGIPSVFNILKDIKLPLIMRTPLIKFFNPVRLCISGAAALPAETFHAFEKKFRVLLLEGYGLTEASPVVTLNPMRGGRRAGSIGKALTKNIELNIVDDKDIPLPGQEIGELLVKGPNVMKGYYRRDNETALCIKDGWLYTGDMAKRDSDGYYYIVGRKKEMVNVRGLNVYPREIEEVLYQHPKIKEAAVVGIADIHKGEVPIGFVVLKDNNSASEHELIHYLRQKLAPYKVPKYIEIRGSLPKNTAGKILKRVLQDEKQNKK